MSGRGLSITNTYLVGVISSVRSDRSRQSERASRAGEEKREASERTGEKNKGMHKINNISDTPR